VPLTFCGLAEGVWSWAAAEAWPAAKIMMSAAAPAEKRDDMKMTSNPGKTRGYSRAGRAGTRSKGVRVSTVLRLIKRRCGWL
jgi:hypothetical protein